MRIASAFAALCLSAGTSAPAQQGTMPSWTPPTARSMAPDEMTARIFADLGRELLPDTEGNRYALSSDRRLSDLAFFSVPRWSMPPGLCDTDRIQVSFEPADPVAAANAARTRSASRLN